MDNTSSAAFEQAVREARTSELYIAQQARLVALQRGYGAALAVVWTMATRSAPMVESSLSFVFIHDAFQTMAATTMLASEGIYAPAKRELRYLLEAAAKHAFVDLSVGSASLTERIAFLETRVPRSSVEFVLNQEFFGLSARDQLDFKSLVVGTYKDLSAFVHRSPAQLKAELRGSGSGAPTAKVAASELESFNHLCAAVYDIAVFLQFQVLGQGLAGDVLVHAFDDVHKWPFHRSAYCKKLSRFYDYKHERQMRANKSLNRSRKR